MIGATSGEAMLSVATVGQLPRRPHVHVAIDAPMWKVVEAMRAHRRGCVLVVDEAGTLVGIFTERDLMCRIDHGDPLWSHAGVRDVMTPLPMVIRADDSLAEALRRLIDGHRRHLPIVEDNGVPIGLLSIRDILAYVAQGFPEEMMNLPPGPEHEA